MSDYSRHYRCFFLGPWPRGNILFRGNETGQKKSRVWQDMWRDFSQIYQIDAALATGAINLAGANDPIMIYDKNIEIEQIRLSVWQ
jgi:hypothetical protein